MGRSRFQRLSKEWNGGLLSGAEAGWREVSVETDDGFLAGGLR